MNLYGIIQWCSDLSQHPVKPGRRLPPCQLTKSSPVAPASATETVRADPMDPATPRLKGWEHKWFREPAHVSEIACRVQSRTMVEVQYVYQVALIKTSYKRKCREALEQALEPWEVREPVQERKAPTFVNSFGSIGPCCWATSWCLGRKCHNVREYRECCFCPAHRYGGPLVRCTPGCH